MTFLFFISQEAESWVLGPNTVAVWIMCHRTGLSVSMVCTFLQILWQPSRIKRLCHDSPGGNSLGSILALWGWTGAWKEVRATWLFQTWSQTWKPSPYRPARLSAAAFSHERFSSGLTELRQFTQSQDMLSPSTRHEPAEPWGGVKKADVWQQGSADRGSSGELEFPECPLIQWSSSPGFQLPSCLPGDQEHLPDFPAGLGSPRVQSF